MKFAPPYRILFIAELKDEILRKAEFKPNFWWRYIDDIFFLWEHGEEKSIAEGVIETDLYVIPTGSHQYLLSSSCNPFYCK